MARKPHLRSVAAASARSAVSAAPSAVPGAALAPASPPAPARTPCRALLGPRPLIDGEDGTNYDVILERMSADVAPADFVEEIWVRNVGGRGQQAQAARQPPRQARRHRSDLGCRQGAFGAERPQARPQRSGDV